MPYTLAVRAQQEKIDTKPFPFIAARHKSDLASSRGRELILYLQRLTYRHVRTIAMLATLGIVAALFIGGRQPVAVSLISHPWDKLAHAIIFALLACTIGLASGLRGRHKLAVSFFGALLVGALDELHQMYLPGREAGWPDFIADVIGSTFGTALLAMKGTRSLHIP